MITQKERLNQIRALINDYVKNDTKKTFKTEEYPHKKCWAGDTEPRCMYQTIFNNEALDEKEKTNKSG
jgi:hypothetical protein